MAHFFIRICIIIGLLSQVTTLAGKAYAKKPCTKQSTSPKAASVTLVFKGLRVAKGIIYISVFDNAQGFPSKSDKGFKKLRLEVKSSNPSIKIDGLDENKELAISAFHDENSNGKMDTNWIGIPAEGFAASKNPKAFMGPPKFEDAKFKIKELGNPTLELQFKYL